MCAINEVGKSSRSCHKCGRNMNHKDIRCRKCGEINAKKKYKVIEIEPGDVWCSVCSKLIKFDGIGTTLRCPICGNPVNQEPIGAMHIPVLTV